MFRVLTAAIAAIALGNAAIAAEPKPLDPPQKVKIAYVPIMKFATAYVAADRGLFKKYGLDVTFEKVKSGTEAIAFLSQGTVDVGGIAIVTSLWNSWNRGLDIRIIAPGGLEPMKGSSTNLLVSKKAQEAGVKTIADLKGKKVGAAGGPGSGSEYLIAKALEQAHLTIRDINLLNVSNPDVPAALAAGTIDAGLAGPPYSTQALNSGNAAVLATDLTPGLMTVAFVGSGKFIKERPEVAQRFVLALMEAARMMQGKDYLAKENIDAYLKYTASTEAAIKNGEPAHYDPNQDIPAKGLADVERVHRENGRTDYDKPIDLKKVIDEQFVEKALADIGKAKN
ncbi:MAG TPA: ABC transporter substrate-binding protein [Pseudolabrys sp.]|jgi:NitT/TauT family transport system substrate-binding protein|nr:ABC transporter substrate-binding protein [Pseudolabrys sp.]